MAGETYTLRVQISQADLDVLRDAQLNLCLAKPVAGQSGPNVVWQTFDPFSQNEVTWTEEYGLYVSTSSVSHGAKITKISSVNVADSGVYYDFTKNATFHGPNEDNTAPDAGTFMVVNNMPAAQYPSLTFGLMQSATINGQDSPLKPLNAALVPGSMTAEFTPRTPVYAWLQANIESETVITRITSNTTKVLFGAGEFEHTLTFDKNRGAFSVQN